MPRKALCFGLNYLSDPGASLNGCINDARNVRDMLVAQMGYRAEDVLLCTDETDVKPTKAIMLRLLREMVLWTHRQNVQQIFISYSGHGTAVPDGDGDEADHQDEALVPLDFRTAGVIADDELGALIRQVHPRTDVVMLVDACHSGSVIDLPFRYVSGNRYAIENDTTVPARVVMVSGCTDAQLSQETQSAGQVSGLMTRSFLWALQSQNYDLTCFNLIKTMQEYVTQQGASQRPQLCTSRALSQTCIFVASNQNGVAFFIRN